MPHVRWVLSACCLAAAVAHTALLPAASISPAEMFQRMARQTVSGVTVITHGFQFLDKGGDSLMPLATSIRDRLAAQTGQPVWLLDYDVTDDEELGRFDLSAGHVPSLTGPAESGHVVLLYDWAPESNRTTGRFADSAGDALFAYMAGLNLVHPANPAANPPLHMIGHSFGTGVTSEAVERLAAYRVPVAQLTYLDPHDFDQAGVPVDENQQIFTLGQPAGYGATVWNNVQVADVYYQTRGSQGGAVELVVDNPEGRPIPGAVNTLLDTELPAANSYGFLDVDSDHSYVWHTFYQGTVEGGLPPGAKPPMVEVDYAHTGWATSVHAGGGTLPAPAGNFYATEQSHEHSEPLLVDRGTGIANAAGLATLGVTAAQIETARFAPRLSVSEIANGDLAGAGEDGDQLLAGWSHHGGSGEGFLVEAGGSSFLRLNAFDEMRQHNFAYVPPNAAGLKLRRRVSNASDDDAVQVRLERGTETVQLGTIDVSAETGWDTLEFEIPRTLRGEVWTFAIEIEGGGFFGVDTELDLDDFAWDVLQPYLQFASALEGVIDFGTLLRGERRSLAEALVVSNLGDPESVATLYAVEPRDLAAGDLISFTGLDSGRSLLAASEFESQTLDVSFLGSETPGNYAWDYVFRTTEGDFNYQIRAIVIPEPAAIVLCVMLANAVLARCRPGPS